MLERSAETVNLPHHDDIEPTMLGVGHSGGMSKEEFKREVEKELTGKETEPHEIIYFKSYKRQIPVRLSRHF
jgi:hypothetical protein